jgi:dihydropteroate synthase
MPGLFPWGTRTFIMGIVNVSPDSFSGDGLSSIDDAVAQARRMVAEGADIIDVGGESTRPQSGSISAREELERVIPALERICREVSVPVSVDTYKYEVAEAAVEVGAGVLNDVWALKTEPRLADLAARHHLPIILMSNQRDKAVETDIVTEVLADLKRAVSVCLQLGICPEDIIVDPGIGFGKSFSQNLALIGRLEELKKLGQPILLGPSRKSFIGAVLDLPVEQRLMGTAASVAIGIARGADIVRVHDVKAMVQVARLSDAIVRRPQ